MINRRNLLASLASTPVLLSAGCAATSSNRVAEPAAAPRQLETFGLQLSTITPMLMVDFEGSLRKVADIGYQQVEFSALGFLGRPTEHVVALLEETGLQAPVGRISPRLPEGFGTLPREQQFAAFRRLSGPAHLLDNVRYALEGAAALNQKHLVLPALMPENFATLDRTLASLNLLREAGALCAEAGVLFGYHNHDWEFKPVEGARPFDLMLERIDPELMSLQLDVYWVAKAGLDARDYLAAHPGRFPSCHLKDIDAAGGFADVGFGTLDFPSIVATAKANGTDFYFVERDNPPAPMATAERAYGYLAQMTY